MNQNMNGFWLNFILQLLFGNYVQNFARDLPRAFVSKINVPKSVKIQRMMYWDDLEMSWTMVFGL